jgi:hypothetical protein
MSEEQMVVPVEVQRAIVERNIEAVMQQLYDFDINIEAAMIGAKDDKDTPEVARLRELAASWMKKRDFFQGKMKELEKEETK